MTDGEEKREDLLTREEIDAIVGNIDVVSVVMYLRNQNNMELKFTLNELPPEFLELSVVDFGGLTDPIGQLSSWLAQQLSGFASWIASAVNNFINQMTETFKGFVQSGFTGLTSAFQTFVITPITNFVNQVVTLLTQTLPSSIQNVINQLGQWVKPVSDAINNFLNSLKNIGSQISNVFSPIVTTIQSFAQQVPTIVQNIVSGIQNLPNLLQNAVSGAISTLTNIFSRLHALGQQIWNTIQNVPSMIGNAIQTIQQNLGSLVSGIVQKIQEGAGGIIEALKSKISEIPTLLSNAIKGFQEGVSGAIENVKGVLSGAIDKAKEFIEGLKDVPSLVMKAVSDVSAWIWDHLPDWAKEFLKTAPKLLEQAGKNITGFINAIMQFPEWFPRWFSEHISKPISDALGNIGKWIWEHTPDWLKGTIENIKNFFTKDLVNFFTKTLPDFFTKTLPDFFTKTIPDAVKNFVDSVKSFPQWFPKWFSENISKPISDALGNVGKWIWEHTPDWFKGGIERIKEFFTKDLTDFFTKTLPDSFKWLKENVVDKIVDFFKNPKEALSKMWKDVSGFFSGAWEKLQEFAGWVKDAFTSAFKWIMDAFASLASPIADAIASFFAPHSPGILETIGGAFQKIGEAIFKPIILGINNAWQDVLKKIGEERLQTFQAFSKTAMNYYVNPFIWSFTSLAPFYLFIFGMRGASQVLGGLGEAIADRFRIGWQLGPHITIDLRPGYMLKEFSKVLWHEPPRMIRYFLSYMAFWLSQPYAKQFLAPFRDVMPIEIPSFRDLIELCRRSLGLQEPNRFLDYFRSFLSLYGYSSPLLSALTGRVYYEDAEKPFDVGGKEIRKLKVDDIPFVPQWDFIDFSKMEIVKNKLAIPYQDRFQIKRWMPLSLMYSIPDESTLARFMVRDIFYDYQSFMNVMRAKGVFDDTALMYYLSHYKYPSPDKLYEFYCRALAGLLWFTPVQEDVDYSYNLMKQMGIDPSEWGLKAPAELNILGSPKASELSSYIVSAITKYMRWHDYAPFNWAKNFTADAWLWMDMMADLPLRVDARWMYKWRTFSALAQQLEYLKAPSNIDPDAFGLSRVVIARGMHPKFVTPVVIGEQMNALTDERTLFRTGVMSAFAHNALKAETLSQILEGMFTVKMDAPVWNEAKKVFEFSSFDVPVRFLPAEQKLLELRTLYDRSNTYFRTLERLILSLIAENYDSPDNYVKYLKESAEKVFNVMSPIATALGLEKGYKYEFDETLEPILKSIAAFQNTRATLRRLRYWLRWSLYQMWNRFAQGKMSDEEIKKFLESIKKNLKLTDAEISFFEETAKFFRDVYRRQSKQDEIIIKLQRGEISEADAISEFAKIGIDKETAQALIESKAKGYVPTIQTLATLTEYVPEAIKLLDKVFDLHGVPKDERPYWKKYIQVKPVMDEIKKLLSEYITDYANGEISKGDLDTFLQSLKDFGFTDEEIKYYEKLAEMRKKRKKVKVKLPTVQTLTTLTEYVPDASKLKDKVYENENIPSDVRTYWDKYLKVKPVSDEVKSYISELVTVYAAGKIDKTYLTNELNSLKDYGLTDEEINFILKRAELRRKLREKA